MSYSSTILRRYFRVLSVNITLPYLYFSKCSMYTGKRPITVKELAARCQVFYRKIYGFFFTVHNYNFPSIQNQTFVCMFLRYKLFDFPKYSTSTEYIIGEYYIILIFATECRFGHALYNHLQERVKLPFSYENYLDSISFLLQIIVSLFWKKETFHRSYAKF